MSVINTRILRGSTSVFNWKIINIIEEETIQSLFDRIIIQYILQIESETLTKIEAYISEKKDQIGDSIEMECLIIDVVKAFGNHLTFRIQSNSSYDDSSKMLLIY
ncbi:hypothetical protein GLOIN_2v1718314 [Rhizophagus clarus]|uniref:Uncharacterized protein n=1 Tax=Rhizophagus clarus TaxID=94130 RepID=A0A8H3QV82_9GLOM|nr:hypothetical protein GLOIN_2v1718314 [Rhizophagus clarus]